MQADRPSEAVSVAKRYQRIERPISGAVALVVAAVAAVGMLYLPLVSGLLVTAVVLFTVKAPLFKTGGTARLVTDAPPEAVRADFESATPPMLAFQWGVADDVRSMADGAMYDLSYLFGLRSVTMVLETRLNVEDADYRLVVTTGSNSWGTYDVTITASDSDETVVDVEWVSNRRFGLNRLPQWLIAERYCAAAFTAQGYTVVDRDTSLSVVG